VPEIGRSGDFRFSVGQQENGANSWKGAIKILQSLALSGDRQGAPMLAVTPEGDTLR
jgi:hypothetical protein